MTDRASAAASLSGPQAVELRRLRWRARRGLLENDLLLGRFLDRFGSTLDAAQNGALLKLLELPDNELLDLLLERAEPSSALDSPDVRSLLVMLRST